MATRLARRQREDGSLNIQVPKAVTASAYRVTTQSRAGSANRAPQWQMDAFAYYDQIGAVRYAAQFAARVLTKIRWFPAIRDEDGAVKETEDPRLVEAFDRFQDPDGGREIMAATFAQLDFLAGESYLLWTAEHIDERTGDAVEEQWEVVSTLELRKQGRRGGDQVWHRIREPGLTPQELFEADDADFSPLGAGVQVYRWWRRHPLYSLRADSPMASVLADCEEIVRVTHTINARLISRLAGPGILAIPMSWKMKPLTQVVGEENPEEDPFQARLAQAMIAAIGNPGSAASVAPIVIRVPDETTESAHLYKIYEPAEVIREVELREKALQRFAVGVEMPPEKVLGLSTSGTQHWNAWMVDEDAWAHIDPVAQAFANNIASSFLRPYAKDDLGMADWKQVTVGYDPAAVLTKPDGFADALKLYEARAVGKAYLRDAGDADDADAMTDDELAEALFVQTKQEVEVKGGAIVPAPTPVPPAVPPGGPNLPPGTNGDGPPTGQDTPRQAPPVPDASAAAAYYRLVGAAEATMEEIRSRVGTRLKNHVRGKCPDCFERASRTRPGLIAAELGPETVLEHGPDLVSLAMDGGRNFVEAAIRMGVSHTQAQALAETLELHVIHTIYDKAPDLPPGFVGRARALTGSA